MSLFTCFLNIRVARGSERDGAVGTKLAVDYSVVGVDEDGYEAVSHGEAVHVVGDAAHPLTVTVAENLIRRAKARGNSVSSCKVLRSPCLCPIQF